MRKQWRSILSELLVISFYIGLVLIIVHPLGISPRASMFQFRMDFYGNIGMHWFMERACQLSSIEQTSNLITYPFHTMLMWQVPNLLDLGIAALLRQFLDFPLYFNVMLLGTLFLNFYLSYRFILWFTKSRLIGMVCAHFFVSQAALIYEFREGRLMNLCIFLVLLALLFFFKMLLRPTVKNILLAGFTSGLLWLGYFFYGYFTMWLMGIVWMVTLYAAKESDRFRIFISFVLCIIVTAIMITPYLFLSSKSTVIESLPYMKTFPPLDSILANNAGDFAFLMYHMAVPYEHFLPDRGILFMLFLAFVILGFRKRQWVEQGFTRYTSLAILFSFLLFSTIALGPYLKSAAGPVMHNGKPVPFLFQWMYSHIPVFSGFRWPDRMQSLAYLCLLIPAGFGMRELYQRYKSKVRVFLLTLVILTSIRVVWSYEGLPACSRFRLPHAYALLKQLPDGALIEIPPQFIPSHKALFYQAFHQKPILFHSVLGFYDRGVPEYGDFVCDNSFIRFLSSLAIEQTPGEWEPSDRADLYTKGYRYVYVSKEYLRALVLSNEEERYQLMKASLERLLHMPLYEDEDGVLYLLREN